MKSKLAIPVIFSILILGGFGSIQITFADAEYCTALEQNLDKLSGSGYQSYLINCTDLLNNFEFDTSSQSQPSSFAESSSIISIGPNVKINSDPSGTSGSPWTQSEVSIDSCGSSVVSGYNDSEGFAATGSFSGFSQSQNDGVTWTDGGAIPTNSGEFNFGDPSVKSDKDCNFYYATLTTHLGNTASAIGVAKSVDGGVTFSTPVIVESTVPDFLDKEHIGIGPNPAGGVDIIHITYTRFTPFPFFDCEIVYERSLDGGFTWIDQKTFNPGECGGQGSIPVADPTTGDVYVFYQDFVSGTMKFFKNTSAGVAASWSAGFDVATINPITNFSAFCDRNIWNGGHRANEFPTAAVNPVNGHIYVSWNQANAAGTLSDIVFFRSTNGGTSFTGPFSPHPSLPNTDQFQPWMDTAPDGEIKMIWYDRRHDPSNLAIDVYSSSSLDGGTTWQLPNVKVTTTSFLMGNLEPNPDPIVTSCYFMGEYIGLDTPNTQFAHASWADGGILSSDLLPQPDVFYATLFQISNIVVGGTYIPIDQSALLLAGVQSVSMWMIPVVIAGIGIGVFVIKRRN